MTPPEHVLTGVLAGTLLVYGLPGEPERRLPLVAWVAIGALAPDVDALSLLFSHATYFGSAWYSHRAFFHSIAGCAVLAAVLGVALPALLGSLRSATRLPPPARPVSTLSVVLALFTGGLVHLAGDLPTPPGPWSGIPLLFPLTARFGGWSHLGWVNAALIYLLGAAALAAAALAAARTLAPAELRPWLRAGVAGVAALALGGAIWFASISRYEDFAQWRRWQARFIPLVWIDALHDLGRPASVFWDREVLGPR